MKHLIVFLASSSSHLFVSSSIQNYNPYNYDLTTPMFTPDGRLMQVEYASQATSRSSPLIVLPFTSRDNEHGIVIGTRISSSSSSSLSSSTSSEYSTESSSSSDKQHPPTIIHKKMGQRRIIELTIGSHAGRHSLTPPSTGGVVIGLSGVLSDNVALLKEATKHLQSWYKSYGIYPPHHHHHGSNRHLRESSVVSGTVAALRVAHIIGDACQKNSFGGGIRPYGAATVVCGVDEDDIVIFCTHPSGSVSKVTTTHENNDNAAFVIGGDATAQRRINNKITTLLSFSKKDDLDERSQESSLGSNSHVDKSDDGTTTDVTTKRQIRPIDAVKAVIAALLMDDGDNRRSSLSSKSNGSLDDNRRRRQGIPPLDILVLTSRGSHRLDDEYIESLVSQIETQK